MLDMWDAHQMLQSGRSADVHIEIEKYVPTASEHERVALAHIRTAAFVYERNSQRPSTISIDQEAAMDVRLLFIKAEQ